MRDVLIMVACLYSTAAWADKHEIILSPDEVDLLTSVIQKTGYNCPLAKLAWGKGVDAYGTVIKVYCGPQDQDVIYKRAVFRFTRLPNEAISVVPWRD